MIAYLGLGSNLGDRLEALHHAIESLQSSPDISVMRVASVYETAPWGKSDQPNFLNTCVELETHLCARVFLERCHEIEKAFGRTRRTKLEPRTLDIDVLLLGEQTVDYGDVTIPHPRLHERRFVLVPLAELAPHAVHPVLHKTIGELLEACIDPLAVSRIDEVSLAHVSAASPFLTAEPITFI